MHTLRSRIADEVDYFDLYEERKATRYCADCRKRTLFTRDMDGIPLCRECEHNDATEALEI